MPTSEIAIPVSVTIIIMGLYIFGGAIVFCKWEEDWDIISSIYFTWVTLTTIGFGDYTPGSSFHGELTIEQVGCFGLAWLVLVRNIFRFLKLPSLLSTAWLAWQSSQWGSVCPQSR